MSPDAKGPRKTRLDVALPDRGLVESRARAQSLIMSGAVKVDGVVVTKPGAAVPPGAAIEVASQEIPYVSRGGFKLRHALDEFNIEAQGAVCLDVGASTGGFTDVLLQGGAQRVYAVDVGYGQLAWKIRNDPRVVVMERTNIRELDSLPDPIDLAVVDVSFISLRLVLPVVKDLLRPQGTAVALIKPQFEAGRTEVGKKGVIRDRGVWHDVLQRVLDYALSTGWTVACLTRSPLKGPAGNVEFLVELSNRASVAAAFEEEIQRVIQE